MSDFLVSYDMHAGHPDAHKVFIEEARTVGWSDWARGADGKNYKLPDTTLIGVFTSLDHARNEFFVATSKAQARGYFVQVTKWIVVEYAKSILNSDVSA